MKIKNKVVNRNSTNSSANHFVTEKKVQTAGFALIATISILGLTVMVSLAMVSLATTATRTVDSSKHIDEARANARLALSQAISALQQKAGRDTRITASARTVKDNGSDVSPALGVWRSWEGLNQDPTTGYPLRPGFDADGLTNNTPTYEDKLVSHNEESEEGRFLGWFVSGPQSENSATNPPNLLEGDVELLGAGSLGDITESNDVVRLDPVPVLNQSGKETGGSAWWVQGLNSKALIQAKQEDPTTNLEWAAKLSSSSSANAEHFGFEKDSDLDSLVSLKSMDLNLEGVSQRNFHDVTHFSKGLLTNSATGGWRRDISSMAELWGSNGSSITEKSFFGLAEGVEHTYSENALIYPWAEENNFVRESVANTLRRGASTSWNGLVDHTLQYQKAISIDEEGLASFERPAGNLGRDVTHRQPVIARIHLVYSLAAERSGNQFIPQLKIEPTATFWNPYNVEVPAWSGVQATWLRVANPAPFEFQFRAHNDLSRKDRPFSSANWFTNHSNITLRFGTDSAPGQSAAEKWKPGETRIYGSSSVSVEGNGFVEMERGLVANADVREEVPDFKGKTYPGDRIFKVEINVPEETSDFRLVQWKAHNGVNHRFSVDSEIANNLWSKVVDGVNNGGNNQHRLSDLAINPVPFMASIIQLKTIPNDTVIEYNTTNIGRGYSHNKPVAPFSSHQIQGSGTSDTNIESLAYDWVFIPMNGVNDPNGLPAGNTDPSNPYGFIGTDFQSSLGLKKLVSNEVPVVPLTSLAQLQHFDIALHNPSPPMVSNAIGNSNAHFLIAPDSVRVDSDLSIEDNCALDHSYVANQLLFDDWFVSSFNTNEGTLQEAYDAFLSGEKPLLNANYKLARSFSAETIDANRTWKDMASKIEVDGMFNVNSASVEAWASLLKSLQGASIPKLNDSGISLASVPADSVPVPRGMITGSTDSSVQTNPQIAELAGFSSLTEEQIEALAAKIVEQVQQRGPFLSLSEFVNRSLTPDESEEDIALAGSIEAALNELAKLADSEDNPEASLLNPFASLQSIYTGTPSQASATLPTTAGVDFAFPAAGEGDSVYGFPAWIRQADILKPLAPILSVRDDSFLVRAYGSSKDSDGNIVAEVWCEAVVQRQAEYVDSADDSTALPGDSLNSEANKLFGRRFEVKSFRWLSKDEV